MSGYILCHTTHTVNKNKHVQAPGKTVKRHKIFSKTNTSDCDKNFENCQGIEKGMSRPECQSHWVQDRKRIRWGSTSSSFSDENIREYSFSRADLESRCWQNSMNPRKKERLGDLKKKQESLLESQKPNQWFEKNCLIEHSDWIIDQIAICGYNPSTHTILNYCSIGDAQQVKSLDNPVN